MIKKIDRKAERERRHARVRNKISGTADRPRLCVFRSNNNLFVQVIDDVAGNTLAQASTLDKEVKVKHSNKEAAKEVGALIAKRALEKNIKEVVFDRGGYIYHGVVKELAEDGVSVLNKWVLTEVWPTRVNGQELDRMSSDNSIEEIEFSVGTCDKL